MLKIGLTGGIGSGKSLVAKVFKILGAPVYHADDEAKRLMNEKAELKKQIIELLGESAYEGEQLNRGFIASKVFPDPALLTRLNSLVHPAVREDFLAWSEQHTSANYIIEEAAILFESGHFREFDFNIVVLAEKELRIQRVMERDNVSREQVETRIERQMPQDEKIAKADFLIHNNGDELMLEQILELHNKFISLQHN